MDVFPHKNMHFNLMSNMDVFSQKNVHIGHLRFPPKRPMWTFDFGDRVVTSKSPEFKCT